MSYMQDCLIKDIHDVLESKEHGETLTKFIAKSDKDGPVTIGGISLYVELHGLVDESGNFIIISERFERKENK